MKIHRKNNESVQGRGIRVSSKPTLLVTGAAGFIGSSFVREALKSNYNLVILDALTYAGHMGNLEGLLEPARCEFVHGRIGDYDLVSNLLKEHAVKAVVNFAAESHVDNSIRGPGTFVQTNVVETFHLLEASRGYFESLKSEDKKNFRFIHVSTDEVFGSLGTTGKFSETTPYQPNSPYSATKAASDHLVRAWFHTYGLPTVTTNCSNNYGPRQFPEKLIPLMITNALSEKSLPVYGTGKNVRDWIHVEDHSRGVMLALEKGKVGSCYCFGGDSERSNIDVVVNICRILDGRRPRSQSKRYEELIQFVEDRKGHDFRYAIDDQLAQQELGFKRTYTTFEKGLEATIDWYLDNSAWVKSVKESKGR
jgi:dTDP-glucose 4,6-dehydratase